MQPEQGGTRIWVRKLAPCHIPGTIHSFSSEITITQHICNLICLEIERGQENPQIFLYSEYKKAFRAHQFISSKAFIVK